MRQKLVLLAIAVFMATNAFSWAFSQIKQLAPGVLKVIPANIDSRDSYSLPLPLENLEAEAYTPNYSPVLETLRGQTQNVVFFRDVWQYEFGFTGLRQIELPLTTASGENGRGNVWYMVYRIRDTGQNISYEKVKLDQRFERKSNQIKLNQDDFEIGTRFIPHFYLNGWVKKPGAADYKEVSYRDQIDPEALKLIRLSEDRNRFLLDKVEMMQAKVPKVKTAADDGIWGVAIWRNVDPAVDFVNVNVRGLTNAYRIETMADGERQIKHRNLQLNFYRAGDRFRQADDRVEYGIRLVDDPARQIEICDRYRLPGPLIRGYVVSEVADQNVLVAELDANIQFATLKSTLTPGLDRGQLPEKIRMAFQNSGIQVASGAKVTTNVAGRKWGLTGKMGENDVTLIIQLEPQYWEPDGEKIRFINSIDFLWNYR